MSMLLPQELYQYKEKTGDFPLPFILRVSLR